MDPSVFSDLLKTLLGLGPGGIVAGFLFYLWKDERTERRSIQEANAKMLEATIDSRHEMAGALEKLADKIKG